MRSIKTLVAVDGYAPSLGAAKEAVEMASREGVEVVALQMNVVNILCVIEGD